MASDNLGAEKDIRDVALEGWVKRLADADKIRLVIAGSYWQFKTWCRRVNRMPGVDAIFIRSPLDLKGRGNTTYEVVKVGTFSEPRWLYKADEEIAYLGLKVRED